MSSTTAPPPSPGAKFVKRYSEADFEMGDLLGEGAYSRVVLAKLKETGEHYAIKIVEKKLLLKLNKANSVKVEKQVLYTLNHPNIISLFCTFQDAENLYFVLELAPGGELFNYINKFGASSVEATRFYAGEIINAMEHMHSKGIIHRDLKPENILLDKNMHVKITDFGTAKILSEDEDAPPSPTAPPSPAGKGPQHRKTFVGTAEYASPELLRDSTSSKSSDLWALGCIIYQLLTGKVLFRGDSEYLTFQKILQRQISLPESIPPDARDLIERLLQEDPNARLGVNGYDELKKHPFFAGVDFDNLIKQTPLPLGEPEKRAKALEEERKSAAVAANSNNNNNNYSNGNGSRMSLLRRGSSSPNISNEPSSPTSLTPRRPASTSLIAFDPAELDRFLFKDETVVFCSMIIKRRVLSAKKRRLILTNLPRLIYIDPARNEQKGEIPLSTATKLEKKNSREFNIITPKRVYNIEDLTDRADQWIMHITEAQAQLR